MSQSIRILLADDHNVLRQGMAQAISSQPDMLVVAQAANGRDAVALVQQHQPDIVLLDVNMPELNGLEAAQQILARQPQIGVIILTMYRRKEYIVEAIKAGVRGYLLKEAELDDLLSAIRRVAQGDAAIDPALTNQLFSQLRQATPTPPSGITERDLAILRLLGRGLTNAKIAKELGLAEKTIRNRLTSIFRALNVKNRNQATAYAYQSGLVDDENSPKV